MTTILYITRNGLLEPLGQSQVLPYLRGLARDYQIILLTREKEADWANAEAMAEARAECEAVGIDWRPKRFRPRPRFVGPARDILAMLRDALELVRREGVKLIHARSYIPAAVAWAAWHRTGTPFIFDMRALWPEELITAGRLARGSVAHRLIAYAERAFLRDAAGIVSLTQAAVEYLRNRDAELLAGKPVMVIPTCADLERFVPCEARTDSINQRVHGCIGTITSGWFRAEWLAAWFARVAMRDQSALFEIVTRDDPVKVRSLVDPSGALSGRLSISARRPQEMPLAICRHDLSIMFFTGGLSKLGSAPTRLAEVLGSGLPVVANEGVGDVGRVIKERRVGVLLDGTTREEIDRAIEELEKLLEDPDLTSRCRETAEELFSLDAGTAAYRALYREILSPTIAPAEIA